MSLIKNCDYVLTDLPSVVIWLLTKQPLLKIDFQSENASSLSITRIVAFCPQFASVTPAFGVALTNTRQPKYPKTNT